MRHAAHAFVGGVDIDNAEVGIAQHQRVGRGIEDRAVLGFAVAQRRFRALAFGDVAAHRQHMRLAAIADRQVAQLEVEATAVAAHTVGLQRSFLAGERSADPLDAGGLPLRVEIVREGHADGFVTRVAEQPRVRGVGVDLAQRAVPQRQRVGAAVEDHAVLLLAGAQGFQRRLVLGDLAREGQDMAAPVDRRRLQPHLVPVQAAVLVAPLPFKGRAAVEPGQLDLLHHLFGGDRCHVGTQLGHRQTPDLVARVAVVRAGLRVHIEDRATVPVVDEDRDFGGFEDGAVAGLRLAQRLGGTQLFDLGRGAHREDLQHRLDALHVQQRRTRGDGDGAQRRAILADQREPGVADDALGLRVGVFGKLFAQPVGVDAEVLAEHRLAGRAPDRIADVLLHLLAGLHRQNAQGLRLVALVTRNEGYVHAQDGREQAHQFDEDRITPRAGHRQRGRAQRLVDMAALDLGHHAPGEDLQQRLGQRGVGDRLAVHGDEQAQRIAVAVRQRERGVGIHALGGEDRAGRELGGDAARHMAEGAPDHLGTGRAFEGVVEVLQRAAVHHRGQRAHLPACLVTENGDEDRGHTQRVGQLAHQIGKQLGPASLGHRLRSTEHRLRGGVPAGGFGARGRMLGGSHRRHSLGRRARPRAIISSATRRGYMADTWCRCVYPPTTQRALCDMVRIPPTPMLPDMACPWPRRR